MYYQYLSFSPMNSFFSKVLSVVFILPSFCCMAQIHTDLLPLIPQKSIKDSEFYIQTHSIYKTPSPHLVGTWIGKYSTDGKCLVKPWQISDITSRPALVVCDGHLYSAYNVKPNLIVDGKKIYRSHLRLSELNSNTQPIRSWDITSPISIQYPCLNTYNHQVYITFVEDRENSNPKDQKGSIAFTQTRL